MKLVPRRLPLLLALATLLVAPSLPAQPKAPAHPVPESPQWLIYPGAGDGPGKGRHIVLIAADQEYRSEQAMPMLAKILSQHHGFKCTVLFSVDADGTINTALKLPTFLDMIGTCVAAIVLGPWWGALVGVITNVGGSFIGTSAVSVPP